MGLAHTTCRRLLLLALAAGIGVLVPFTNVIRLQTTGVDRHLQVVSSTSSSTSEEACADILVSNAGPFDGLYSSYGNDEINDRFAFTCQRERGCETELPPGMYDFQLSSFPVCGVRLFCVVTSTKWRMRFLLDEDAEASYSYEYQPPDDLGNPGVYGDYLEVSDGASHPVGIAEEWTGTFDGTQVTVSCGEAIVSDTSSSSPVMTPSPSVSPTTDPAQSQVLTLSPSLGAVADPATSSSITSTSSPVATTSAGALRVPNHFSSTLFCVLVCAAAVL